MHSLICVWIAEKKTDFKMLCPNHLPKNTKARGFQKQFEVSITSAQIEKTIH